MTKATETIELSVMHHSLQHGDVMKDPDLVVEVFLPGDEWLPVGNRQDSTGGYDEAVSVEGTEVVVGSRLVDELSALWTCGIEI
jgi:hypothetical protein